MERGHFKENYNIDTHRVLADRLSAAQTLREEAGDNLKGCPILVDQMDDQACRAYAALPERLYVMLDGRIVYQGGMGPFYYNIDEVEELLAKMK